MWAISSLKPHCEKRRAHCGIRQAKLRQLKNFSKTQMFVCKPQNDSVSEIFLSNFTFSTENWNMTAYYDWLVGSNYQKTGHAINLLVNGQDWGKLLLINIHCFQRWTWRNTRLQLRKTIQAKKQRLSDCCAQPYEL